MSSAAFPNRRRLVLSAAAKWGGFAVQILIAFYVSRVLVHALGDRRYGIWSLVDSILAYLMLFDLGVAASLIRYIARFEASADQQRVNRVFSTSIVISAVAGAAVLAVAGGLALAAPFVLAIPADLLHESRWMLFLLGFNLGVGLPLRVFTCVLEGLGRYPTQTAIRTACLLVRTALVLLVVWHDGGLVALALAITACNLLEHAVTALAAWWFMPSLRFGLRFVDRETFRDIRGYGVHAFLAMLAGRISVQTNAIVISVFLPVQNVTYFALAGRLVEYAKDALHVATTVLTPAASALESRGQDDSIRRMFLTATRYVLYIILPVQLGLWLLGKPFLALWMGPQYAELSYPTLCILAVPLSLAMAQSVSSRILYGLGRLSWFARIMLAEAFVNLALGLVLVQSYGIEGVALGTAIPNVIANVVVIVAVCRGLGVGVGAYVRQAVVAPVAVAALLGAAWCAAVWDAAPVGWGEFLLTGGLGVAGYGLCVGLIEFGPGVWSAMVARAKRKPVVQLPL